MTGTTPKTVKGHGFANGQLIELEDGRRGRIFSFRHSVYFVPEGSDYDPTTKEYGELVADYVAGLIRYMGGTGKKFVASAVDENN